MKSKAPKNIIDSAMVLSKFRLEISQFDQSASPLYNEYTLGLYFDAELIHGEISKESEALLYTFKNDYVLPLALVMGALMLIQMM